MAAIHYLMKGKKIIQLMRPKTRLGQLKEGTKEGNTFQFQQTKIPMIINLLCVCVCCFSLSGKKFAEMHQSGITVKIPGVGGLRQFPQDQFLSLNSPELNMIPVCNFQLRQKVLLEGNVCIKDKHTCLIVSVILACEIKP